MIYVYYKFLSFFFSLFSSSFWPFIIYSSTTLKSNWSSSAYIISMFFILQWTMNIIILDFIVSSQMRKYVTKEWANKERSGKERNKKCWNYLALFAMMEARMIHSIQSFCPLLRCIGNHLHGLYLFIVKSLPEY